MDLKRFEWVGIVGEGWYGFLWGWGGLVWVGMGWYGLV